MRGLRDAARDGGGGLDVLGTRGRDGAVEAEVPAVVWLLAFLVDLKAVVAGNGVAGVWGEGETAPCCGGGENFVGVVV